MKRFIALILVVCFLGACGGEPTPAPDLVATQIAVEEAAHATMTAKAPTATPKPAETQEKFIQRCVSNDVMNTEFPDEKQRISVCYAKWRKKM